MAQTLASLFGLEDPKPAQHIETLSVRLGTRPRVCKQAYGKPYFKMICADGTVAVMVNAEDHQNLGDLKPGTEVTLKGRWAMSRLHETYNDAVFHIEALVS